MPCSQARLTANRDNAKKSTGPNTEEGKAQSRQNALKDGMTGAGTVLPPDMIIQVRDRERGFAAVLGPCDEVERDVVRQMALASVRSETAFTMEMNVVATNRFRDLQFWDDHLAKDAEERALGLDDNPALTVIELRQTSAGCDWLALRWEALSNGVGPFGCTWSDEDLSHAFDLLGVHNDERMYDTRAL